MIFFTAGLRSRQAAIRSPPGRTFPSSFEFDSADTILRRAGDRRSHRCPMPGDDPDLRMNNEPADLPRTCVAGSLPIRPVFRTLRRGSHVPQAHTKCSGARESRARRARMRLYLVSKAPNCKEIPYPRKDKRRFDAIVGRLRPDGPLWTGAIPHNLWGERMKPGKPHSDAALMLEWSTVGALLLVLAGQTRWI